MNQINLIKPTLNKWNDFIYPLEIPMISENTIKQSLSALHSFLLNSLLDKNKNTNLQILILFKVKTLNHQWRTISYMQSLDITELTTLEDLFIEYWNLKEEDYNLEEYSHIIYTYNIIDSFQINSKIIKANKINNKSTSKLNNIKFGSYKLPSNMDFHLWGYPHYLDATNVIVYKKNSNLEYHIKIFDKYQEVELKLDEKILLSFKDTMNDISDLSTFTREFKNQSYIFQEGNLKLKKVYKKVTFISKSLRNMYYSSSYITMDLETRIINDKMTSYCVSIYDGEVFKSFFVTDYTDDKEMLRESLKYLMKRKYHNYKVYLHNFSNFDVIFLLNVITDLSDNVKPVIRDGRFINLRLRFADKYNLYFRDSYLILPVSLKKLAKEFNVTNKGLFPYRFVNDKNISLDYKGNIPDYKYFDNIYENNGTFTKEFLEYQNFYKDKCWDLRQESIKYCELDCFVLYQIINKFSLNIFKLFRMNILEYPTLSSLAFAIFRNKFLKDKKIPVIKGEIYDFIRESYTGGSVDVYKPRPTIKKDIPSKVYRYDVNSLYPFAMRNSPMPTGHPTYFEGDILNYNNYGPNNEKPFGIFEAEITSPKNIKIPLLQLRIKTNKGYRTIAPIGNWTGKYFSDELYNAEKYGYNIKIKKGYLFNKDNIFEEYVDYFFDLKKKSIKGSPYYLISKLLLNSLYGRLGMSPYAENHLIINNSTNLNEFSNFNITNVIDLKNGKQLLSFVKDPSFYDLEDFNNIKNISVVVSSIVTASARIYMSKFKTDKNLNIYYSDTDSIDIDKELDSKYIGTELGQMKLEHIFNDAIFLSPKMYGGVTDHYEYVKIKGLKNPLKFEDLKSLLKKDSTLEIKQQKWYSDISNGLFNIKDEIYTLMVSNQKRKNIFNHKNEFVDTEPLILKDGILLN
jgi:hypothetical protein